MDGGKNQHQKEKGKRSCGKWSRKCNCIFNPGNNSNRWVCENASKLKGATVHHGGAPQGVTVTWGSHCLE